jgi:hypothetical protein
MKFLPVNKQIFELTSWYSLSLQKLVHINTLRTDRYFFLYIYHTSLIQSKVSCSFLKNPDRSTIFVRSMYCVIKSVKTKRVLKGNFASSVFHSCNAKDANLRHRSAMC